MTTNKDKTTKLQNQIERETGLRIVKIEAQEQLGTFLNAGLAVLYQTVFAGPPYNEKFSTEEVKDIFQEFLDKKGNIFVALNPQDNKPVAFVVSVPLRMEFALAKLVKKNININEAAYFAEDCVAEDYRRNGLSGKMKKLLIETNSIDGLKKLLLRTNQCNYKQISAVNKSGGTVIPGLFNEVVSKRGDGTMITDKRAFYTFDTKTYERDAAQAEVLERVVIVRPGGNDTALVFDQIPRTEQGPLSLRIQKTYPGIEQVMFVEKGAKENIRGQMAGGEFCGNATRSLGFVLRDGKEGAVTLEVSGANEPAQVFVSDSGAKTSIPLKPDFDAIRKIPETGEYIVDMDGISFLVTTPDQVTGRKVLSLDDEDERKVLVQKILEEKDLAKRPASGVLIARKMGGDSYEIDPFVFVRDTGTLYYESGCGSGSTALGAVIALENNKSVEGLAVVQPSGGCLHCLH